MPDPRPKGNTEEEPRVDIKRSAEYRQFKVLLRKVVKAPPMPRTNKQDNDGSVLPFSP